MQSDLFIAVAAGLAGMLGWGLADFFAKKTIDIIGDVASLTWGHIFGTLVLGLFAMYEVSNGRVITFPSNISNDWPVLIFFGFLQAAVYLLVYRGFAKGQLALLNPIFSTFSGFVALFSILILGEVVTGSVGFGLLITFFGVFMLSVDFEGLKQRKINFAHIPGFREVACATVLAAIWTISWSRFTAGKDWLSYTLCMYGFMTFGLLVYCFILRIKLAITNSSLWKFLFLIGFCEVIAYLGITLGYSSSLHTSVIALLSGGFSLPTIILARMFLKEKVTKTQTIGTILIIIGIMCLSIL